MDDRIKALLAHLTPIGWIISLFLNSKEKGPLTGFYLRQCLGIWLLMVAVNVIYLIPVVNFLGFILMIGVFLLWLISVMNAAGSKLAPLPFVGELFQDWFQAIGSGEKVS